jgi:hypothetical protein
MEMAGMIDNNEFSYYPGDDGGSEYLFNIDLWIDCQKQLTTAEVLMRMLALQYNIRFLSNIKGYWPSRRLQKKRLFKVYELRLMLNHNYCVDGQVFYELNKIILVNVFGFYKKILEFSQIKIYSSDQVNDRRIILNDLQSAISSL